MALPLTTIGRVLIVIVETNAGQYLIVETLKIEDASGQQMKCLSAFGTHKPVCSAKVSPPILIDLFKNIGST